MMPTPPVRLWPAQAPSANRPAVHATYPMVWANKVCAWLRAAVPICW
jgi:hypothetical protein